MLSVRRTPSAATGGLSMTLAAPLGGCGRYGVGSAAGADDSADTRTAPRVSATPPAAIKPRAAIRRTAFMDRPALSHATGDNSYFAGEPKKMPGAP
jgi:hypothetical protein